MSSLTALIDDLTHATAQLQQLTRSDDWTLVETLQKRRSALLEQLTELAHTTPLSDLDTQRLQALRVLDAQIRSRANARRQSLGDALERLRTGEPKQRKSRMREAYGDTGPKR